MTGLAITSCARVTEIRWYPGGIDMAHVTVLCGIDMAAGLSGSATAIMAGKTIITGIAVIKVGR